MAGQQVTRTPLKPGKGLPARAVLLILIPALVSAALLRLPWPALDAFVADPSGARITATR